MLPWYSPIPDQVSLVWSTVIGIRIRFSFFVLYQKYRNEGRDTIILAGAEYGSGSSRDWAAKGPMLLVHFWLTCFDFFFVFLYKFNMNMRF